MPEPRTPAQRKADALSLLAQPGIDAWVASASDAGDAHLVPLSLCWAGERIILATERSAVTTRNIGASGRARVGVGATRDVVMIDATLDALFDADVAPDAIGQAYADQADWDPREDGEAFVFLVLRPTRIQAWRESNEIEGRTLMRDGAWLVD